jgi:hypothetical protein
MIRAGFVRKKRHWSPSVRAYEAAIYLSNLIVGDYTGLGGIPVWLTIRNNR